MGIIKLTSHVVELLSIRLTQQTLLHMMKQIFDEALVKIKPPMIMVMGSEPCLLIP